jgi:hypothetical protein
LELAGRRDSAFKDSWELQNSSPTPTIGALSPVELKPASGIFDVLMQIDGIFHIIPFINPKCHDISPRADRLKGWYMKATSLTGTTIEVSMGFRYLFLLLDWITFFVVANFIAGYIQYCCIDGKYRIQVMWLGTKWMERLAKSSSFLRF